MTEQSAKPIQAVAIDIDGTLLNSRHELTSDVEKALRAAAAKGVQVILATGKTRVSAQHLIEHLKLSTHGIFLQGAAVYDAGGRITHQATLDPHLLRRVVTYAEDRGYTVLVYSGTRTFARKVTDAIRDVTVVYHEPLPEEVGSLFATLGQLPIHKAIMIGPDARSVTALRWQLTQQVGSSARLIQAGIPTMLEVLPSEAGKEIALRKLLKDLNIEPEAVMAIGDAENDVGMLQMVGVGVAMGQAAQAVKEAARHVTLTNDEHGAARAIERFVLNPEPVPEASKTEGGA
jgi:hypothetical protein